MEKPLYGEAIDAGFEYRLRAGDSVYVLPRTEVLIGRDASCFIRLEGDLVSRRHAVLIVMSDRLVFRDLGSSNGSWVNDVRVEQPVDLRAGDRIRIGWVILAVESYPKRREDNPTLRLVHCDACGAVLAEHMKFCVQCGHRLTAGTSVRRCPACGREVTTGDRVCPSCGVPITRSDLA